MQQLKRRLIGYGLGATVAGVLGYVGFIHKTEADTMTLLSSAEVHLKLAKSMPKLDAEGKPNPVRGNLLDQARDFVERARVRHPDLYLCLEMTAYINAQRGWYLEAAELYRAAQSAEAATPESRSAALLNEVRMWRIVGQAKRALDALDDSAEFVLKKDVPASQMEKVYLLRDLDRSVDSISVAAEVARSSDDPLASIDAGLYLEESAARELAEKAFRRAAEAEPMANYYLARLKVRAKEFDIGLDLLRRVVASNRRQVQRLVELDAGVWNAVRSDARFTGLFAADKSARPGR